MHTNDSSDVAGSEKHRYFIASVLESAIAFLNLTDGARVLDAGTGPGVALPPLARAVGMTGSVLAVDNDPTEVTLAVDCTEKMGIADRVTVQLGDVSEVLADAATAPEKAFDAIWSRDAILTMYFGEPADVVRQMAQALRPGGVVALFYSNHLNSIFLPGYPRLERGLYTALEMYWGLTTESSRHKGGHLGWLQAADLDNVNLTMCPRVCFPVDADPTIRPYLEQCVWPLLRKVAANHGAEAGLSRAEVDEIQRLVTPGHPDYILDKPGYYHVLPGTLATGRRLA
jgi:SAM-dependent methyltransferase